MQHSSSKNRLSTLLVCFVVLLSACQPPNPASFRVTTGRAAWTLSDVRYLEQPNAQDPALDLYAVETRLHGTDLQIRLEVLDSQSIADADLYLALDTRPGGSKQLPIQAETGLSWDILLIFKTGEAPRTLTSDPALQATFIPRISRDPVQDTIVVSINRDLFPGDPRHFSLQAFLTRPGEDLPVDSLGPVRSDAWVYRQAPLLLAYWDSLPSDTPAQTLRRWDGAHTGPEGSRNGLRYLLQASYDYNIPIALLDLKTPERLSALEYIGGMKLVRTLLSSGSLLLPDVQEGSSPPISNEFAESVDDKLGVASSQFQYGNRFPVSSSQIRSAFARLTDPTHIAVQSGLRLIPLPGSTQVQTDTDSDSLPIDSIETVLSIDVRKRLVQAALSQDPGDLVVLGGSLSNTTWADFKVAGPTLSYLANHPWIHALNAIDLLQFPLTAEPAPLACPELLCQADLLGSTAAAGGLKPSQKPIQAGGTSTELLLQDLNLAPPGHLTDLAWRMAARLTTPSEDLALNDLRRAYLGQIRSILLASAWSENPSPIESCEIDADDNGVSDCVLANEKVFAVFQSQGARLTFAFSRDDLGNTHQIIGPLSQFSVGISDPSMWDLSLGPLADPNEIPGAFTESSDPLKNYTPVFRDGSLRFTAEDGSIKQFSLSTSGVHMDYQGSAGIQFQIPLALDPLARFQKAWGSMYHGHPSSDGWTWSVSEDISVTIQTGGNVDFSSFMDSHFLTRSPEDPDQDYPPGHYLPYPLALATIQGNEHLAIDVVIQ